MEKLFVALRSEKGNWRVVETRFAREVGDAMTVENVKYIVVTTGSRSLCIDCMNFSAKRNTENIKRGFMPVYPKAITVQREKL